jgi:hypothetical protein
MNQNISGCKKCDQLLTAFGEAVLYLSEIKKRRGPLELQVPPSGREFDEYRSAQSKCRYLRFVLMLHLNQHEDLGISARDSTVWKGESGAPGVDPNQTHDHPPRRIVQNLSTHAGIEHCGAI